MYVMMLITSTIKDYYYEMVTPIPKVPHPKVIDDMRNISGLTNVHKVLEKVTSL